MSTLLQIRGLTVSYASERGPLQAVRNIDLDLATGQGWGWSAKAAPANRHSALLTLLPASAQASGQLLYKGRDLLQMTPAARRDLRGNGIATVSQDPFTALNPVVAIGKQLVAFQHRRPGSKAEKLARAQAMLERVGISDPPTRLRQFPHELSGGIRQRVAIAASLLTEPELLIADEPTTALDATTEMQIIALLRQSRDLVDAAIMFVTHDLHLVASLCDRVAVMYAGEIVEAGPVAQVFATPAHPYTQALLACDPARILTATRTLPFIPGHVPSPSGARAGCPFQPRCTQAFGPCASEALPTTVLGGDTMVRCHKVAEHA